MNKNIKIVFTFAGLLLGAGVANAQNIYPNDCFSGALTDYQTSWFGNNGGTPRTHVPHSIESIFVRGDGTVATICGWDEGGTNVGIWKNGAIVSIPVESGTGSWGRNSGKAVAIDDQYVYQLMRFNGNSGNDNLNSNGLRQYPPKGSGIEWQLITRYNIETGSPAVFSEGYGPLRNMLLVVTQDSRLLQGLAITDKQLIVAVPGISELSIPDSLKIYDKTTMSNTAISGFRINEGGVGYLHADKRGFVWMLQPALKRIVAISLSNGGIRTQSTINLPADADIKSFSIDTRESGKERLLAANSGKDLNILIYTNIYTSPTLSDTFGVTGGNLVKSPKEGGGEYLQGEAGPLRFPGPTGVGVDDSGNIYVSNMFVTTPTAALYSYNETTKAENWKQEGLAFTSTADFDQTQLNVVFSTDKMFELDYTKKSGRMDKLIASTLDPFAYPRDFRTEPNPPTPIKCGVFKRKIQGKDYLFVTNMYSSILGGYRFDKENKGYIAIPCMEVHLDGFRFWQDANGDGQQDASEIKKFTNASTFSIYPDQNGNIWMADRSTQPGYSSFRYWKLNGITAEGLLQYADPVVYRLPAYVVDVNRVLYDAERDEMLVSCYTQSHKTPNTSIWGQVGTTILTFQKMTEKMADGANSANWTYEQELLLPASAKTSTGTLTDPGVEISSKAMTFAGDYIFCHLSAGNINVYERSGKNLYAGQIVPGDEVQKRVGWTDFTYSLNARKNADGTYEILAEENAFAKMLHYDLRSFAGTVDMKGDLTPEWIRVKNGANQLIDATNIPNGQPIKFTVRVKNIESGTVTNNRRTDPGRCLVSFKITNSANQVVYEAQSNVHEEDIYGGEYVDMSIDNSKYPFWYYTPGIYKVDVDVNYGKKGKECLDTNNTMTLTFGGGVSTGEITGPMTPPSGINDVLITGVQIYPNPASEVLHVVVGSDETDYTLTINTLDGKSVLTKSVSNRSSIDVSGWAKGCYLLQITSDKEKLTRKVIIK
ncbi:hypothetical protein FACS189413_09080 [Bacteroidia bacterium]|nr:hypothetical protein FACS189413_09080 [Bacteroidia bacterium]